MKNKIIIILVFVLIVTALFVSSVSADTSSFKISGTVFYDENGNGWHDGNETQFISSARSCKGSIIVKGAKIKVVAEKEKSSKTNYYQLDYCGMRTKAPYSGFGVYYDTRAYEVGTKLTMELIVPEGWKSTMRNPIVHEVESEYYIDFAMTKVAAMQQQTENAVNLNVNAENSNIQKDINTSANNSTAISAQAQKSQDEIGQQKNLIVQEQNMSKKKITELIDKVEKRSKLRTFLFGADYKNLGELRSEMIKIGNKIEQLKTLIDKTNNDKDKVDLLTEIQTLQQEQAITDNFITQNENKVSLFGWLAKLFQ